MSNEWLEKLKAGDKVIYNRHYYNSRIIKVERITKTMVISGTNRFSKKDGHSVGYDCIDSSFISEATDKTIDKILEKKIQTALINTVSRIEFSSLTTEKLKSILSIVDEI